MCCVSDFPVEIYKMQFGKEFLKRNLGRNSRKQFEGTSWERIVENGILGTYFGNGMHLGNAIRKSTYFVECNLGAHFGNTTRKSIFGTRVRKSV